VIDEHPLCPLTHLCAVCGKVALPPGHGTRGTYTKRNAEQRCPKNFLVRCAECSRLNRKLEGQILAVELDPKLDAVRDRMMIVYEII